VTVQQALDTAHRQATDLTGNELAAELQAALGQKLVAYVVGDSHPKTIGRYARGEREPPNAILARLVNLYNVMSVLEQGMRRQTVKSWLLGANPHLRDKAPADLLHEGKEPEVMRAARIFINRR
jgi:hypothetical protein